MTRKGFRSESMFCAVLLAGLLASCSDEPPPAARELELAGGVLDCGDHCNYREVVHCATGVPIEAAGLPVDVDPNDYANNAVIPADSLSGWHSPQIKVIAENYWTSPPESIKYLRSCPNSGNCFSPHEPLVLESLTCARDMEVYTWFRVGTILLRLTEDGRAIYVKTNGEPMAGGILDIGIGRIDTETYEFEEQYLLYRNSDLAASLGSYSQSDTADAVLTVGVSGFDIYVRYNGEDLVWLKEHRHMSPGKVALVTPNGYGARMTAVRYPVEAELFSRYEENHFDLRDLGVREIVATGSIAANDEVLELDEAPDPPFQVGDHVIVETGGEAGGGLRGTKGVGSTWPALSFANAMALTSSGNPGVNWKVAWEEATGTVYRWSDGAGSWVPIDSSTEYYRYKANPRALVAEVVEISGGGATLTLDKTAAVAATDAKVYLDVAPKLQRLVEDPTIVLPKIVNGSPLNPTDFTPITPKDMTIAVPTGTFALGQSVEVQGQNGVRIEGNGPSLSTLFSPRGTPSVSLVVRRSEDNWVGQLALQGNALEEGFGHSIGQTMPDQSGGIPLALNFVLSDRGRVDDVTVTDVFHAAVGASQSDDVWAEDVLVRRTDTNRSYVGWQLIWDISEGGGCVRCEIDSEALLAGFSSFNSTNTSFIDCRSRNAVMAFNGASEFVVERMEFEIDEGSERLGTNVVPDVPLVMIHNHAGAPSPGDGLLQDVKMIHHGYINEDNDVMRGIVIAYGVPGIRIIGGRYVAPDYVEGTTQWGAAAIDGGTSPDVFVADFEVVGRAIREVEGWGYPNIQLLAGEVWNSRANTAWLCESVINENNDFASAIIDPCTPP